MNSWTWTKLHIGWQREKFAVVFNPNRGGIIFFTRRGRGGHYRPGNRSATKWIKSATIFICMGPIHIEWATNQFSCSYCRYLQYCRQKTAGKIICQNHKWKYPKISFLVLIFKLLIWGQIWGHTYERYGEEGHFLFSTLFDLVTYLVTRAQKVILKNAEISELPNKDPSWRPRGRFFYPEKYHIQIYPETLKVS